VGYLMAVVLILVFLLALAIAWVNGANDVSKGIATLFGSGVTNLRRAVFWGAFWTGMGGLASAFLAKAMVQTFGKDFLAAAAHPSATVALAATAGAVFWITIATRKRLPVSTTHAIVGGLVGVASVAYGTAGVNWSALGEKIFLPLLLSPVISLAVTTGIVRVVNALAPAATKDCVCVEVVPAAAAVVLNEASTSEAVTVPAIHVSTCESTHKESSGITLGHLHWLTSGATSFARGLNDTPKMVALVLAAMVSFQPAAQHVPIYFVIITAGIIAGSCFNGRKVTEVLAMGITPMSNREGFIANLVTSALVGPGAALGLPMSTTHVASGAIMGLATGHGAAVNWKTVRDMLLAWVVTLPVAALAGIAVFYLLKLAGLK
jgi:inorganic phosphate transporter, PiT family